MNIDRFKLQATLFSIIFAGAILVFSAFAESASAQTGGGFEGSQNTVQTHQQGFSGPYADPISVKEALSLRDDSLVVLRGNIVKGLGGEYYLFRDSTGEIQVEIDHDVWQGLQVGPEDTVTIYGEMDKDWSDPDRVDVDRIVKM